MKPELQLLTHLGTTVMTAGLLLAGPLCAAAAVDPSPYLSPAAIVATADGQTLYVACATGRKVLVFDVAGRKVTGSMAVPEAPTGLALSPDQGRLFVTCAAPESSVCVIDLAAGKVGATWPAGHTALGPVLSPDGKTLYVCNRFSGDVSQIDLEAGKEVRRIRVRREPVAAALTRDGKFLLVANHLHNGRSDVDVVAAAVSVIETATGEVVKELSLPNGSGLLRDIQVSPDGKHAVVTHVLARFHLPTTQLERGWMNTNAKSIIDLATLTLVNTVLLDNVDSGAANPWGAAWTADGKRVVVAHSGTHEVSVIDFPALLAKLAQLPEKLDETKAYDYTAASRVQADVPNDLSFLVGVRRRVRLPEGDRGPRAVAVIGTTAYVANYYSDSLTAIDFAGEYIKPVTVPLGGETTMDAVRMGEFYFNDAGICFQGWQSCGSCHSEDARVDGLNWDLLNDGIGNPKNSKTLLLSFETPPAMSMGVRDDAATAVRAGIRHILFTVQPDEVPAAIDEYVKSLRPIPSPLLEKGQLSAAAQRGEKLYNDAQVGCASCHPAGLYTDKKHYDVGTRGQYDREVREFDTPSLVELWRTAPYLHDGSAATARDVLTTRNVDDQHGKTSHLSAGDLDDLVAYLLSL